MIAGLRLAFGLLTIVPAGQVDAQRPTVRDAMLLAPVAGLALGTLAWAAGAVVDAAGAGPLLAAVASVAALTVLTRALHLDGVADLADGLGSGLPPVQALEVMRRSDIGPFGVVTLVLVLLTQVAAVAQSWELGLAAPALVVACVTGRLALTWACRSRVPAARPDGLGALVAGSVPATAAAITTGVAVVAGALWGWAFGGREAVAIAAAVVGGLTAAMLLLRHAARRIGGVTGDVLGAVVETGTTGALVVLVAVA